MKWLWLSALVVALDQATKYIATSALELYESIEVLPFFNLTLVHNFGAAFSFLSQAGGWQRWFFSVLAFVVSVVIIVWLPRVRDAHIHLPLALSLVLGGTLGNLVDRMALGYVVDFLDFHAGGRHWPAFNVADTSITLGALFLILDTLRRQPEEKSSQS
ncbi:MAG: Lipoprotein signal peptidase [Gammaproteobacteria bacterium]|nr:Lipoprotein signal peptidase [Gammaproteobacteria bacterium]